MVFRDVKEKIDVGKGTMFLIYSSCVIASKISYNSS